MTKTPETRDAYNARLREETHDKILQAALKVANKKGGWTGMTRDIVAAEAGYTNGMVSKTFGTMTEFRRTVMRHAVKENMLVIIGQGIASGDKTAWKVSPEIRRKAIESLL